MKKAFVLMMAGILAVSTPMSVVHAESNGELNLEDELITGEGSDENSED